MLLRHAIKEDVEGGDVTTNTVLKKNAIVRARIIAKQSGVLCGTTVVVRLARLVDKKIKVVIKKQDGSKLRSGDTIISFKGPARSILKIERVALNYLGRLSGIATLTADYAKKTKRYGVDVFDTRKTTPNLRLFERCAVRAGGGCNHRFGLFDQVLIKDNHIAIARKYEKETSLAVMVKRAKNKAKKEVLVEVEVDTLAQLRHVLKASPDIILLDNMEPAMLKKAVTIVRAAVKKERIKRPILEASGGVTLNNVTSVARTGIDRISIGALTHSATGINFSLEII